MHKSDDLESIRQLKARYCRFVDTQDWPAFAALFTADVAADLAGAPPSQGIDAFMAQVTGSLVHVVSAHHVHNPEIAFTGADEATAIWAMQDRVVWQPGHSPLPDASGITGYGHYHERYVRQDGEWRIASVKLTRLHVDVTPAS